MNAIELKTIIETKFDWEDFETLITDYDDENAKDFQDKTGLNLEVVNYKADYTGEDYDTKWTWKINDDFFQVQGIES